MLQATQAMRFSGLFYDIPLSTGGQKGTYSVDNFLGIVKNWDEYEHQYSDDGTHTAPLEAAIYQREKKLYGALGAKNIDSQHYLAQNLIGQFDDALRAPFKYDPNRWQVGRPRKSDNKMWLLMSRNEKSIDINQAKTDIMGHLLNLKA